MQSPYGRAGVPRDFAVRAGASYGVAPTRAAREGPVAWDEQAEQQWRTLSEEVMAGLQDWQAAHPRATFAELEAVVDERLNGMRARMLENLALARAAAA